MSAAQPIPRALQRLSEAGLPLPVQGFASWLVSRGGRATMAQARAHFGITPQHLARLCRDLEALGIAERQRNGRQKVVALILNKNVQCKRKPNAKTVRCKVCGVLVKAQKVGGTGDHCAEHKQTAGRSDAPWIEAARKLYRKGLRNPNAIHARLAREGYVAPVADYLLEGREKRMPGLISWGIKWGYLDAQEWGPVNKLRQNGEDVDE